LEAILPLQLNTILILTRTFMVVRSQNVPSMILNA
jgi:hypothetical protein